MAFSLDNFLHECRLAAGSQQDVRAIVERAVSDRAAVVRELGEPATDDIKVLFQSDTLTVLNVIWPPRVIVTPHDHTLWAVIGIYSGREDNIFWRQLPGAEGRRIEAVGATSISDGDTLALSDDVIHSVINPLQRCTGAIHVYGGDVLGIPCTTWDPETLFERPGNGDSFSRGRPDDAPSR
jgi:predicted metal-dependent enzyme (double-stranded beta helix superfamily)